MISLMRRLAQDESGVAAIEYCLIAAGISVAILGVVNNVGGALNSAFTSVANAVTTAAK